MGQGNLFEDPSPPSVFPSRRVETATGFVPLTEIMPAPSAPRRVGIARFAAQAPEIDARNGVEYHELPCRTLLSRCDSRRVPFDFTINPYRGCELACGYCYAPYTHEFMELEQPQDFERKVFVKAGAREALIRDLRRLDLRGRSIAIGTATDPYQPAERRYRLTRALLEVLAGRRGLQLSLTTKSDLVARDVDLLARLSERNDLHVNVTITTPHYALARQIEPRAPRPDKRLAAVRRLADSGVKVGVFLMPVMPHVNDAPGDLELLIRLAKEAGAHYLVSQVLFMRDCSRKRFFPFLAERFPELLPDYRRLYDACGKGALAEYTRRKLEEIRRLKEAYGLSGWSGGSPGPPHGPDQLALTW
jgi:DNA repair photolyase